MIRICLIAVIVATVAASEKALTQDGPSMEDLTEIPASVCEIAGIPLGSSEDKVLSILGTPNKREFFGTDNAESESTRSHLSYDTMSVNMGRDIVNLISVHEESDYSMPNGLHVGSSRQDVIALLGETDLMENEAMELLSYRCEDLVDWLDPEVLIVQLSDEKVRSLTLLINYD